MLRYLMGRLLGAIPLVLVLTFAVFVAVRMMPGGRGPVRFDGDRPVQADFLHYIGGVVRGDLGYSGFRSGSVAEILGPCYRNSLKLALGGTLLATVLGVLLGVAAARRAGSAADSAILALSLTAVSIPLFFSALLLMLLFSLRLRWLPSMGLESWKGYVLPILTLGLPAIGFIIRATRAAMLEALGQPYIRAARARGLPEGLVIYGHALPGTLVPVLTAVGVKLGELLAQTVLIETAFSLPGIGRLMVDAVTARDYAIVQGCVLVLSATFLGLNIVLDLLYCLVDPRVRPA